VSENIVRVPRWIIRKAWEQGGERLEGRIQLLPESQSDTRSCGFGIVKVPDSRSDSVDGKSPKYHVNNEHTCVLSDKKLLFDNWEYRFWAVELINYIPQCAECRNCRKVFGNVMTRRNHPSEHDCFKILIGAYELLLKDKKCVVCDKYTHNKAWGVPLCAETKCRNTWMHGDAQPQALLEALTLVSHNNMESSV
jgi:hypothetical protein